MRWASITYIGMMSMLLNALLMAKMKHTTKGWIARNVRVPSVIIYVNISSENKYLHTIEHKFIIYVAYNQLKIFFCNLVLGSNNRFFLKKGRFYCFSRKLGIFSFIFLLTKGRMWNQIFCNVISMPGCKLPIHF